MQSPLSSKRNIVFGINLVMSNMDSIFVYAITLIVLPLSVIFLFYLICRCGGQDIRRSSLNSSSCPPGSSGLPFLGETIQFAFLGSSKFITDRMKKYSPHVFLTSLLGEKMAVFCGADGNKFIFTNDTKLFTVWYPRSVTKVLFSKDSIGDQAAISRKSLLDVVKTDSLKQYVMIMDAMARQHIEKQWAPYQQVKAYNLAKMYTFDLACQIFIGVEDPTLIKRLSDYYRCVTKGLISLPIDLPGTAYNSAIKGGKMVRKELLNIIKARRKEQMEKNQEINAGAGRSDLLSRILQYSSTDKEITNNIIGLLLASYETTSSVIAFVLKHLAELPHIYNEVLQEQMEIAKAKRPDDLLTIEDIENMKYLWNVVCESLRVTPPSDGLFRKIVKDCTYAGFKIQKGWKIHWNIHTTHKDPRYFPNPEKFDPTRFDGSGPLPYSYVPFGGGNHTCPGKEFAKLQILVFVHNIVRRFTLEKVIPNEKTVTHMTLEPKMGLPLRLHPIAIAPDQ